MNWSKYIGKTINVTMNENYGVVYNNQSEEQPVFYEIVFKTGKLIEVFEDALLLEHDRKEGNLHIWIPKRSIKCVEIYGV